MHIACLLGKHKKSRIESHDKYPIIRVTGPGLHGRNLQLDIDYCSRCNGLFGTLTTTPTQEESEIEVLTLCV